MKLYTILLSFLLIISCSNDDSGSNDNGSGNETTKNYFPQNTANTWEYETTTGTINTAFNGTTTISGNSYNVLENHDPIFGFPGNSNVRKSGNDYFVNADFTFGNLPSVSISDEKFLDEGNVNGDIINTLMTNSPLDSTPINQDGFTGNATPTVFYELGINMGQHSDAITLNGIEYTDVIKVDWTYKIAVDIQIVGSISVANVDTTHHLVEQQQVGTLTQYYANNIGVVRSEFNLDMSNLVINTQAEFLGQTVDLSPFLTDIQDQLNQVQTNTVSDLTSYNVN